MGDEMRKAFWPVVLGLGCILVTEAVAGQAKPAATAPASSAASKPVAPAASASGPSFRFVGTVRDVMHAMIEPFSNVIFDAVVTDVTAEGIKEKRPETDEEWDNVEHGAIALAESANLLRIPGRAIAEPREMNIDPEGPELPPAQIAIRVNRNRAKWLKHVGILQDAAVQALKYARAKDVAGLLKVGETIDTACENCHLEYWYPDDAKNR
jgi:hypothetical protein